jgi:hypothetical protein
MTTLYNGGPVMGGTFPALIWASVISAWQSIQAEEAAERAAKKAAKEAGEEFEAGETEYVAPEGEYEAPVEPEGEYEAAPAPEPAPEPEAAPEVTPEAAPEAAPEPSGGGGGVTAG